MRFSPRLILLLAAITSLRGAEVHAASRLYGTHYTFSAMNFPGNLGETEDPVTREVIDHGTPPANLTFDGIAETAGGMKINERAVAWDGLAGGIHVVQDATRDGLTEFDLTDWELPGEVVEFSFETVNNTWVSGDEAAQSAVTMRDLMWANSDAGSLPEFYSTGFYMWFSKGGAGVEGYSTQLPEIGLLVGPHPFDPTVPEVFYIDYSNSQVQEVTAPYDGGVDLTFGTTQLDENDASWAALANVMGVPNIVGNGNGMHIGFLVSPPLGHAVAIPGDVNSDGRFDVADIDAMTTALHSGQTASKYDVNKDGSVGPEDRVYLVDTIAHTYFGDANLDGQFDSDDFVLVFVAGEYEDGVANNSTWGTGDWDGNLEFDSDDFITAFVAGGYEAGPRLAVAAVPEPNSLLLLSLAGLMLVRRR